MKKQLSNKNMPNQHLAYFIEPSCRKLHSLLKFLFFFFCIKKKLDYIMFLN